MPLPWAPSKLLDDVDSWSFTNTASSAMAGLADMGSRLMAPVGQQVRQVVERALPPPPPASDGMLAPVAQPVAPRELVPSVPTFSLGKVEDWITPTQPRREVQMPEAAPPPAATAKGGGFSLPPLEAFIPSLAPKPAASASSTPSPAPSAQGAAPGPAPTGDIDNSSRASFVASAWPHMLRAAGGNRDAAEMMLAAAISENGSVGTGKPFWANNFFGIKGQGDAGSVDAATHEIVGGARQDINDRFAAYSSPTAGFAGFFDFLQKNPRYQGALQKYQQSGNAAALFHDVNAAGYATDPAWAAKVENIRANQVAPITKALGDAPPSSAPPSASPPAARQPTAGPGLDVGGITAAYNGVPYTFGGPGGRGQGVGATTDCSGFVSAVWQQQYGLDLPAHTDAAYNRLKSLGGAEVSAEAARPGDVVFYMGAGTGGAIAHHMGIFAGPGQVLDMSVSGGSGVKERPLGHGGSYVIVRDPRLGAGVPQQAAAPPPIVPTGVAEATGGRQLSQRAVDAASERPRPFNAEARAVAPPGPVGLPSPTSDAVPAPSSYNDPTDGGTLSRPLPAIHDAVMSAFRSANGRDPDPSEVAQLAALGYGLA